ncbi:homogentisate 1,2-dioxygenase [Candidatus Nitrospira inopinata]|jgi:homogentisate 1,2-dioxygenase|uniref:Putative dioxygenase VC_1345 n=1 Tax=Candidatus Nitrospira inopinata TaxID=1715989 RepID=A0A0S4KNI7_9BACT|nr:homogentisate 1,2-dioxygenase [Candidatus Nitrospira inopinata]CUQ65927.1 putative dioxygenase VC_1345 [Candidatus Nitrospira inopinata]
MYLLRKGKTPNQAHVGIPEGLHEEEHGRNGFNGPASHLYRVHPPTAWVKIEGPLKPRAFFCAQLWERERLFHDGKTVPVMQSRDVRLLLTCLTESMTFFVRNGDGDELWFVHQGRGRFETDYGVLPYEAGDYVVIPKGTTYRVHVDDGPAYGLIIETPEPIVIPDRGPLGHHALFDKGVLVAPELEAIESSEAEDQPWEVRIKRQGAITSLLYPFYPMDVVGWKGDLWVAKLNVRDFRPVTSPRYHLPPSAHVTFQAGGCLVSTFAPRPLETDPEALRVPFYHRNMDYDEVLFYHQGEFFSRAGIEPGMLTLHPQGIHHGPQPQAVQAAKGKTHTNEVAVMIESRSPFEVEPQMETVEVDDYAVSWSRG